MTDLPTTMDGLLALGFSKETDKRGKERPLRRCIGKSCRKPVLWLISPRHKRIAFDPDTLKRHAPDCPDAEFIRLRGRAV